MARKVTLDPDTERGLVWILTEHNAAAVAQGERPITMSRLMASILHDVVRDDQEAQQNPVEVH